jgi:hypothetical protein
MILQTYHPTSDGERGTHAFTTENPLEGLALARALRLRDAIAALLNWSGLISESVAQSHGEGRTTEAIRKALNRLEVEYSQAGGGRIDG